MQTLIEALSPFVVIFGIILAVLWIALPFAVFAIKGRIDDTNILLKQILDRMGQADKSQERLSSPPQES